MSSRLRSSAGALLLKIAVQAGSKVKKKSVCLKEHAVPASRKSCCDFASSLDSAKVKEGRGPVHGLSEKFGCLGFTLSLDNSGLFVLHGLFDLELGSLSLLLGDLFLFDGLRELRAEVKVSNGDIVELDVEVSQSDVETVSDSLTDLFSLCQQLRSIVSSDDGLKHFVNDRWENSAIVVETEESIDLV